MNPILNIAIRAIRVGGKIITQYYDSKNIANNLEKKKIKNYLNQIQKKTFIAIFSIIHKSYPEHSIINNFSKKKNYPNKNKWLINPLNGKINFIQKIPHFCLSILFQEKNKTYLSVIYDPIKNDLFTAIKGQGAQLNGFRTRCCEYNQYIHNTIITIYLTGKNKRKTYLYMLFLKKILQEKLFLRQTGCLILDLAYLSSGKISAYIGFNIKYSYIIFGELQIRESGALITDFTGGHNYIENKVMLIGHSNILKFILKKTRDINLKS
ncbi:inositol monophosphatase family protein [Buchnera aphidicola]|uniref:Inositol-1-monophosphatase n=1 Tax=Buchnera aphidicola (Cinara strobi) TaxID=1921549 RepID=A0A3B1DW53_9GAMM|nr:inositol monophosphatase family protein [Buchnera aphidicola]VAX76523.1 Inositol-1-monophosphatase [Buchnera aphidicola (Cinara strobi)]